MDLKRGAAYWASSMAGLFLLLAFPALFDGIEGLRWPAFFVLILKAVFYAVLGRCCWPPSLAACCHLWDVALVELIRIFSCVIFLMDTWDFFSDPGVLSYASCFFIASLIFAVIHYGRTQG